MQICPHKGVEITSPDDRDAPTKEKDEFYINRVADVIKACFPGVKAQPSIVETCIYSVSYHFITVPYGPIPDFVLH